MVLFYLIFFGINCVIGYFLFQRGKKVVERLQADTHFLTLLDAIFLVLEVIVLLFIFFVTIQAIGIEFTNKPKPYFLTTWVLGVIAYGILNFLRQPVEALVRRRIENQADS